MCAKTFDWWKIVSKEGATKKLRYLSLLAVVSSDFSLKNIHFLPKSLQIEVLTVAAYSGEKSVAIALQNCDLAELSEEVLSQSAKHMKDDGWIRKDYEEGIRSLILIYGYLHALQGPVYPRVLRKLTTEYLFALDYHLKAFETIRKKLDTNKAGNFEMIMKGVIAFSPEESDRCISWDIIRFMERNTESNFKLILSEVEVICFSVEDSLERVLASLHPDLEGLTFRVQYPVHSCLHMLKKFTKLQKLTARIADSQEGLNYFAELGNVIHSLKCLDYIDIGDGMDYTSGDLENLLAGLQKSLKGFRFGGIDVSEEDLNWMRKSNHCTTLKTLDLGSVDLMNSREIVPLLSEISGLEELVLDECKMTKYQLFEICASLRNCTRLQHLRINQFLLLASNYNLRDSIMILEKVLSIKSRFLQYVIIDAPSDPMNVSHPSRLFITECSRLLKEHSFSNVTAELVVNFESFKVPTVM